MKISYNWLKEYLPEDIAPEKLSEILTGIGLEVEETELKAAIPGNLEGLFVGLVETCKPHDNADKLRVTTVRVNESTVLPIVCGAPNVASGQKVLVATVGATLYPAGGEPFKIKKSKIRGEISEGMICAEDEIGMGADHEGIMVLPEDTPVGLTAAAYFRLPEPEIIYTIGLTPNRSDANSHLGTAKDVCAYLSYHQQRDVRPNIPLSAKSIEVVGEGLPVKVKVENIEACSRYSGILMKNVTVGPSPEWLKSRLRAVGIHAVNNVVDITNFVLQEYGQPLHAFDYDKISGREIIVKNLPAGTGFITLDNQEQTLSEEDLMICDGSGNPMCMAGVYGGLHSGISDNSTTIFIESAYFQPRSIRRSSVRHNLRTEAATHFEKGVDMKNVLPALKRAVLLIQDLAGAEVACDIIDLYPDPQPERTINFSYAYLDKICGKAFEPGAVKKLFGALGFTVKEDDGERLVVGVPAENPDIFQPADLAEEVLRIDGLDNIPVPETLHYTLNQSDNHQDLRNMKERMAEYLAYSGLQEIITNSITNSRFYPEQGQAVKLMNSLSSELDILRPEMLESGLEVIAYNVNRKMADIHIFEFGKTYADKGQRQYEQTEWLGIWSTGNSRPQHWAQPAEASDIYLLKGMVASLFTLVGLKKVQEVHEPGKITWKRGRQVLATLSIVAQERLKLFGIKQQVYFAAIHLENLFRAVQDNVIKYAEAPRFPAVKRDLALVVPEAVRYEEISAIAGKQKWEALINFDLFDIFEHEKIGKGNKSMALSFTFQLKDRTLTDKEVDDFMNKLISDYQQKVNATIRS
ncbi:MAG TPA: phenylalanine--tRNA ligase subunit beta [Edaphocola sp.]|nr:phenylalanine--tRNA ligase subunit beta [Edaphocola sp.]